MTPLPDHREREPAPRPGHDRRRRRAEAILRAAREDAMTLVSLTGLERAAQLSGLPTTAIEAILRARPATQRRFARALRERLGLSRAAVAAASALPDAPRLERAVRFFGVALRLAGEPRVIARERRRALAQEYGEDEVLFGLFRRGPLSGCAGSLAEIVRGEPGGRSDAGLFTAALAAGGSNLAAAAALRLGLPPPDPARPVTDALGAPIDALGDVAQAALVEAAAPAGASPAHEERDVHREAAFVAERGAA